MQASFHHFWERIIRKNNSPSIIGIAVCFVFLSSVMLGYDVYAADGMTADSIKIDTATPDKKNEQSRQPSQDKKTDTQDVDTLPEVSVIDSKEKEESGINPTLPITTITTEQLQRSQSSNIFEAVRSVPGVSTTGGPRASGMTFSIRGYADSEDVLVKVDGAPKGFEKYRMGGTFIEPELLKSIEVQRGPQISSASGALGGTVIATTKNAGDLLKPGQKVGAKAKFGYGNNNDEYSRSYMVYGRPHERLDILYNYSNRQSNFITLPDKTKLDNSAIRSISELLKISFLPTDDLELVTSLVTFDDSGLQPYDASGGQPGTFGNVIRATNDFSWTQAFNYTPDNQWINLKAIFAGGYTKLHDLIKAGEAMNTNPIIRAGLCNGVIYTPNPANTRNCGGNLNDYYDYRTRTVDLSNKSILFKNSNAEISLLAGWQYNSRERQVERFYDNRGSAAQDGYPDGINLTAPSGERSFRAFYIQPNFQLGQLNIKPGYRRDDYEVVASGGSKDVLDLFDQAYKLKFSEETFSLGLAYDLFPRNNLQQLTIYSNYGQGFRPPLLDEYFTLGGFGSRCFPPERPSGICGDLYRPQTSESTEAGISYQNQHLWGTDIFLTGKVNFYHIKTSNLLLSMRYDTVQQAFVQDGWERRNGVEIETFAQYKSWFLRGSYSRISGEIFDGRMEIPLYTVPGNALYINLGAEITKNIDVNLTYRKVSERDIITAGSGQPGNPYVFGLQDSYELWNVGMHWQATPQIGMRLIGENLTNNEYRYDSAMGGLGILGPGRNVKFFVEMVY